MSKLSHKINRQIFELEASRIELAKRAQADISRMYPPRIASIIEQVCSEVSPSDRIHRIDRVDVDLGVIGEKDFARELLNKLEIGLRSALGDAIQAHERQAEEQGFNIRIASFLELFACFSRTGSLPWWADATRPGILEENALELMRDAPRELSALVRELVNEPEALRRMSLAYADAVLAELCELLGGGREGRALSALPPAVGDLHKERKLAAGIPATRYRSIAWQCSLRAAARASQAGLTGASPVAQCEEALAEVAEALNITWNELLSIFKNGAHLPGVRPLFGEPPWSEVFSRSPSSLNGPMRS
jgi:hypothetical protein